MTSSTRIWVAGQHGMVGSAIVRLLQHAGFTHIVTSMRRVPDLTQQDETLHFMQAMRPEIVVMTAGRVGGIVANSTQPVEFLIDNARMAFNVLESATEIGVKKLLYLGSSCIYPRQAPQPMKPEHLLTGQLEQTNEAYALAKIAGVRLCQYYRRQYRQNFISAMPCNLYGVGDRYHETDSHVIPALLMKFYAAIRCGHKEVECLGDGSPRREFLYVDDLARACLTLLEGYNGEEPVNIGASKDVTIHHLASTIARVTQFGGKIKWAQEAKLNGTPQKLMDSSVIQSMGWRPRTSLSIGLQLAWEDYSRRFSPENVIRMDEEPTTPLPGPWRPAV